MYGPNEILMHNNEEHVVTISYTQRESIRRIAPSISENDFDMVTSLFTCITLGKYVFCDEAEKPLW